MAAAGEYPASSVNASEMKVCLPQVEEVMKESLRKVMASAVEAYPLTPRQDWVLNWPGQVVLAASVIHWTAEVSQV